MAGQTEHIREIEKALDGRATGRDPHVIESWNRCVHDHALDPARAQEAIIVTETRLREHRQQAEELISIARSGLDTLYSQVADQKYVLILSDAKGVTVDFLGDAKFDNHLRKAGLYLGSEWLEGRAGTCAVGACLASGEAMVIHQSDHFDITHTPLSCTASPIYDTVGELTAVLDVSLLSSPIAKASQNLALHMVKMTARRIELANLMARTRHEWVLRFARTPDFLDVDPEAAISLDGQGRIAGMTHAGARMLAQAAGTDWRRPSGILGRPVSDFFEVTIDDLPELTRSRPSRDRIIRAQNGPALFAHAIEPQFRIQRRLREARTQARPDPLRQLGEHDPKIIALQERAAKLAPKPVPVLIQGETGTGKEYLARALHAASGLRGRFVAVNCAAIPETLIEGELFGHVAGAFTGAVSKGRKGLIEEADGGTLFLDEIGDMPLTLQARLLRFLSEREVMPIGSNRPKAVNVRVLSASHHDLEELCNAGRFRQDLFYRLNAATLTLPALREREDLDWLIDRILARHSSEQDVPAPMLRSDTRALLHGHDWPGNVRELDNALNVAGILADDGLIRPEDLPEGLRAAQRLALPGGGERSELEAALEASGGNVSQAARQLGINRSTVHRRMRRLGLSAHA
ncbi:sigma-54-dependent Fis family transcriptional regulator [Amaricoccus macauensis]|uniref:sigma-54-dependent Fis family transcriptional regulator n=1 Tax=Amaricoccus macauensis TaxID=57001 RepID=UPI003C79A573